MVVPSEKNSEILDLKMIESSEFKDSALNNSNSDHPIVPPSPDRTFERDKSENEEAEEGDNKVEQPQTIIDIAGNKDNSLAIEDSPDSPTTQQITKSNSVQSLQESDNIDLKVLEDSSSSSRSSVEDEDEGGASASACLELLAEQRNISKPCLDSTYLETSEFCLEESQEVLDLTEPDKTADLSSLEPSNPLLTSTPHSLPPVSRTRVCSSPLGGLPALPPLPPQDSREEPLSLPPLASSGSKSYDYLLKVLLVGDSDVGKQEILSGLDSGCVDSVYCSSTGAAYKTTTILIDGKRVKLQIWDTSGQGRFCTIIRSYSRGAQGILLVYDITNKWSFEGMDRWVREVEEHAPGIPKVSVGTC